MILPPATGLSPDAAFHDEPALDAPVFAGADG
jgi:hypothetical protein